MINSKRFLTLALICSILASCKKENSTPETETGPGTTTNQPIPAGFNFSTTRNLAVNLRAVTNDNSPIKGVMLQLFRPDNLKDPILKGATDKDGYFTSAITLPTYIQSVVVMPHYIGLPQKVEVIITNNAVNCVLGGKTGASGNIKIATVPFSKVLTTGRTSGGPTYEYMGTYDNKGRPVSYLLPTQDVISTDLLSFMNGSLPDGIDTRTTHPEYLADQAKQSLDIVKRTDVWITFVSEGAGNQNSFGYYVYDTSNPPQTYDDLSKITIIFPNVSDVPTGGGLQAGDKVNIGTFDPGKSIGFVLLGNAWTGSSVNTAAEKFYTDNDLNSEPSTLKKHGLLLTYKTNSIFLVSFEDLNRTLPACDHDFNDVVFYATTSESNAISRTRVPSLSDPADSDGDGVTDTFDEYPNDPSKAYSYYYPSENNWGTLAFEDNWPKRADYDLNDLVISYRYKYVSNSSNKIVGLNASFGVYGGLADFSNGFGVEFPFSQGLVSSATGERLTESYISLRGNGTESGQNNAVIIPFDNHKSVLGTTREMSINFSVPQAATAVLPGYYNPFLISNKRRGYEIHLPNNRPTALADASLFRTFDDNSNIGNGFYYLSSNNLPWAINFGETFNYPKEGAAITDTYLHFMEWATSNGSTYQDWYKTSQPGYVNWSNIH